MLCLKQLIRQTAQRGELLKSIIKQKMKKKKKIRINIKDLKTSWKKASNSYDCNAVRKLWGPPKQKFEILSDVLEIN